MKAKGSFKIICHLLSTSILVSGCSSITLFRTTPEGADIYISGENRGITPSYYSDTKIAFSSTPITFRKDGYHDLNIILKRNEQVDGGAIWGGIMVYIPFLWFMKYNPTHFYTLEPLNTAEQLKLKDTVLNSNIVTNHDSLDSRQKNIVSLDTGIVKQKNIVNNDTTYPKSSQKSITKNEYDSLGSNNAGKSSAWSNKFNEFSTMNAEQLTHSLKNARTMAGIGIGLIAAGGLSISSALIVALGGAFSLMYDYETNTDPAMNLANGLLVGGSIAVATGIPLVIVGASRKRRIQLYMQMLEVKPNSSMAVGLGLTLRF